MINGPSSVTVTHFQSGGIGVSGSVTNPPGKITDLQDWLQDPAGNFGWLILGGETSTSAKRFDSRERANVGNRPSLEITFQRLCPFQLVGDLDGNCKVDCLDLSLLTKNWLVDCTQHPRHEAYTTSSSN